MVNIKKEYIAIYPLMVLLCLIFSILIIRYNPIFVFGLLVIFGGVFLMFHWPEIGTLVVIFIVYANIPVIAKRIYDIPQLLASSIVVLLFIPIAHYVFLKKERFIVDNILLIMLIFLIVLFISSFFAKDIYISIEWIAVFIQEGLILYLLIINVIRNLLTLKRVIWALMLAGSLLGGISLYQELTQSYDDQFGGLVQRSAKKVDQWKTMKADYAYERVGLMVTRSKVRGVNRAGGPMEEPNRFAQILLVLLPLAFFCFWGERSRLPRLGAIVAASLILCGVLLSYSRGGFLTLALLLLLVTCMRYIRPYQLVISVFVLLLLITLAAPGYFARLDTIRGVEGLFSDEAEVQPDGPTRGRLTEMLAALMVFLDHPILGVGPGQYTPFYSKEYQLDPDIAFRYLPKTRRAHSLYFELAAETGFLGITTFMAIVLLAMRRLWHMRRRWLYIRPDLANLATAFLLSLVAYLGTAMFLHLSYQRYYWLLLAVAGAALQVFRSEISPADRQEEVVL